MIAMIRIKVMNKIQISKQKRKQRTQENNLNLKL